MKCPYCKGRNLYNFFRVEKMPMILSACPKEFSARNETRSFEATLCKDCYLGFNSKKLTDKEFKIIYDNYFYISPQKKIGHTKYVDILDTIQRHVSQDELIVDIGCSEGYILYNLKKNGYKKLKGIEPGPQSETARELGLDISTDYFDIDSFKSGEIDCFVLMHVFEHFDDPFSILETLQRQLKPDGKIIIEVPDFYGYHHQHLFFYNAYFFSRLALEKNLKIVEHIIDKNEVVLRVVLVNKENSAYKDVDCIMADENIIERAEFFFDRFKADIKRLNNYFSCRETIYWWGAGSTSVIFLNQIDKQILKNIDLTIVDGDSNKWGMYIPGINIKVKPFTILTNMEIKDLVIGSSLHREIKATLQKSNITVENIEIFE